jgi:drug/metabolite transporter (DMT)-like permease
VQPEKARMPPEFGGRRGAPTDGHRSARGRAQAIPVTPYLRLFGAQLAIGAAAIFARFALTGTGPLTASALRLAIGTVPVAAVWWFGKRKRRIGVAAEIGLALAGLALAAHFATWITSLRYTSVAVSTLLVCTSPIWTGLYESTVRGRPIGWRFAAALGLAGMGLTLVATRRDGAAPVAGHALEGDALALAGGIAIAVYLLIVRHARERVPAKPLPIADIVVRTYAWATVMLAVASLFTGEGVPPVSATTAWLGILAMGLISQAIGHTALNAALRDFSPNVVAMSTLLEPVAAALLAAAIFRETLPPLTLVGGVCVLIAVGLAIANETQPQPLNET